MNIFELLIFLLLCPGLGFLGHLVWHHYGWLVGVAAIPLLIWLMTGGLRKVLNHSRKANYDLQSEVVTYPDSSTGARASRGALWTLGSFALLFAAIFVYSAPSGSPLVFYTFAGLCGLMAVACFRQARLAREGLKVGETSMFGPFKLKPFLDGQLGQFRRSDGHWKGNLELAPCGTFRLSLVGSREAPDPRALGLAKELPKRFNLLKPKIQASLFEHYAPYEEAVAAGELTGSPCLNIANPEAVWPHVMAAHVLIEPCARVEIAFKVAWDTEHTVAAIFRDWQFIELNGSVRSQ
jgi:hypothetical protein